MAPARPPGTSATHVHSSQVSSFPAALHFHTKARRGPELAESINKGVRNEDIVWKAPSSGREKAGGRIITRVTQGRGKRPWPTRKKAQGGALCGRSRAIPPPGPPLDRRPLRFLRGVRWYALLPFPRRPVGSRAAAASPARSRPLLPDTRGGPSSKHSARGSRRLRRRKTLALERLTAPVPQLERCYVPGDDEFGSRLRRGR